MWNRRGKGTYMVKRRCIFSPANPLTWQEFFVRFSEVYSHWQFGTCTTGYYALSQLQVYAVSFCHGFSQSTFSVSTMASTLLHLYAVRGIILGWNDCMWQQYEEPEITLVRGSASWQHVKADALLRAGCSSACRECYRLRTWTFTHM